MISRRSALAALAATGLSLALPLHTARAEGAPLEISGGFLRASPGAAKIGAGFVTYTVIRIARGRARELHPLMWLISVLFVIYFTIEPIRSLLGVG